MGMGIRPGGTPIPRRNLAARSLARAIRASRNRRVRLLSDERGFTLIELLVVIIVLGLLVGLVGPRLFGRVGQSKQAAARAQIELLGAALDQYRLDVGGYPDGNVGLEALQRNPNVNNWNGPYLKKSVPKDPWGNAYRYRCCPGQFGEYDLWSEGADSAPGGEGENADVTSWDATAATK
jgi:general secretion pathway protein G